MDTTHDNAILLGSGLLCYEQLWDENARLRRVLSNTERALGQARQKIGELTRLVEKL